MKKLIVFSFVLLAACSKSSDSAPAPGLPPIPNPPRDGGSGGDNKPAPPVPNPPAPNPRDPKDPWPGRPTQPPSPPPANQGKVQENVVWDCKNEKTGSSVQINGFINDIERRVYLRVKDASPILIKQDQYSSTEKKTRYCLPEMSNGEKTEYVFEILNPLTTTNKTSMALLTHYRKLESFPSCDKVDSSWEFDKREGLTCTRAESAFNDPDPAKNPAPVDVMVKGEWPGNWDPAVKTAIKSLSGYTYLLMETSRESKTVRPRILRLNRDLSRDVSFGQNGVMEPTLPPLELGSDTEFETYTIVPDSSDGFFLYGRLDQSSGLFVAHYGANGQLKKDFLSTGFVRLASTQDSNFYRSMVFTGSAVIVSWDSSFAIVTSSGVTKHVNDDLNRGIRKIYDLSVTQSENPTVFMTVDSKYSWTAVWRMDKNGEFLNVPGEPHLGNNTSRQPKTVIRTVPAPDNSFYAIMQEDTDYYNRGNIIHIRRWDKNNRQDNRFDVKITIPLSNVRSFNSDNHDGRFALMADNSLLVLAGWKGEVSGKIQLGAVKIDPFGNRSRLDVPEFRASIGMQGFNFAQDAGQALLTDENGQLYSLGTYEGKDGALRVLSLKLSK